YESKAEGNHPPVSHIAADNIFESHVEDGHSYERLDQRRKPQRAWCHIKSRGDESDGMRYSERRNNCYQRAKTSQRNDQAEQKQQVIDAFEDVIEPQFDES